MRKMISVVLAVVVAASLAACSLGAPQSNNGKSSPEKWRIEDFSFYDEAGKEKAFTTVNENVIQLSEFENLSTHRDVSIGDRAITALSKYEIPFDLTLCESTGSPIRYTKEVDLEAEIRKSAVDLEEFTLMVILDEDFAFLDAYSLVMAEKPIYEVTDGPCWSFAFVIYDEKISDIYVMYQ